MLEHPPPTVPDGFHRGRQTIPARGGRQATAAGEHGWRGAERIFANRERTGVARSERRQSLYSVGAGDGVTRGELAFRENERESARGRVSRFLLPDFKIAPTPAKCQKSDFLATRI